MRSAMLRALTEEREREARREGERSLLLKQLRKQFGRLPAAARERVEAGTDAELDRWALRLLSASSLEEVLGRRRSQGARKRR